MENKKISTETTVKFIEEFWPTTIQPSIEDYIRIDNLSRSFDKDWNTNDKLVNAAQLLKKWVED
jgi:hypothetical protein